MVMVETRKHTGVHEVTPDIMAETVKMKLRKAVRKDYEKLATNMHPRNFLSRSISLRVIKNHMIVSGQPYRGWVRNLKVFVNISIHAAAVQLRNRARESGPRYAGFGPWAH